MAASEVAIANSALIKIGAERIDSLSDSNPRAILCNEQYAKKRDGLLLSHPWNFAIERVELAEVLPVPIDGWEHKFALPNDCLRVLEINEDSAILWAVEGPYLHTNESSVMIRYIKKITDTTKFSKSFDEVLALSLAADICYAIKKDASHAKNLYDAYRYELSQARSFDAQEGSAPAVVADDWFNSRL